VDTIGRRKNGHAFAAEHFLIWYAFAAEHFLIWYLMDTVLIIGTQKSLEIKI
jgi:hypothetical protein